MHINQNETKLLNKIDVDSAWQRPHLFRFYKFRERNWTILPLIFIMNIKHNFHFCHDGSTGKESACNAGDLSLIPELERSPGERKGYPLQYSGLENSMDRSPQGCRVRHN